MSREVFNPFNEFFVTATTYKPFPYQKILALADDFPAILSVPTGAGKTAAVILAWLWKRRFADKKTRNKTPRRLVYCLPMRVLVEQTRDEAETWLKNLGLLAKKQGDEATKIKVTVLMGGEDTDDWDYYPERDAIIIGTQDMLLSRALNRGYGMSRYRWPVHYALLNNGCLWVMDEVQLMGVGVETSTQMQAFRKNFGCSGNTKTLWMSATVDTGRLKTVDHPAPEESDIHKLRDDDLTQPTIKERRNAKKSLKKLDINIDEDGYCTKLAKRLVGGHIDGTLSLAIINTVARAQKVYHEVETELDAVQKDIPHALIHSRFRSEDRKHNIDVLLNEKNRIVVATQVVEAGVDVSAALLLTEIAPWPSLVQRFGRCNRYGEHDNAEILWTDIPTTKSDEEKKGKKKNLNAPYAPAEIDSARKLITGLDDAGIKGLEIAGRGYKPSPTEHQVIRKRDVVDLFDTTPDLTGNDLDVSRYIRESNDTDIQVFWRKDVDVKGELFYYETPDREELCSVPIGDAKTLLGKPEPGEDEDDSGAQKKRKPSIKVWRWNPRDEMPELITNAKSIAPGQVLLLDCKAGGYDKATGWDLERMGCEVEELQEVIDKHCSVCGLSLVVYGEEDSDNSDRLTYVGKDISLSQHTEDVEAEIARLTEKLGLEQDIAVALKTAALWHDVGKSHPVFQNMFRAVNPDLDDGDIWAKLKVETKSCPKCGQQKSKQQGGKYERPHFRHELASALAWLQNGANGQANANLIAYLIAAHHGKVRLLLRSMPGETKPPKGEPYARGVWDGDKLFPVLPMLPAGAKLDLTLMELGEGSWLERTLSLRDAPSIGPFRLAYYEMLLRIADWNASRKEATK